MSGCQVNQTLYEVNTKVCLWLDGDICGLYASPEGHQGAPESRPNPYWQILRGMCRKVAIPFIQAAGYLAGKKAIRE